MRRRSLRIPTRPFVSTSAISRALMRAGQQGGFDAFQVQELWCAVENHYSSQQLAFLFDHIIKENFYESLFLPDVYWADGGKVLFEAGGKQNTAIRILGECLYQRSKTHWLSSCGSEPDLKMRMKWNDFNLVLLESLVTDGHSSADLAVLLLERDLGL